MPHTVRVNESEAHLQKRFPLLCCFAVTNAAPEDTDTALEDPQVKMHHVSETYMCVQTQHSLEEAFCFFRRTFRLKEAF